MLIELRGVSARIGGAVILRDVDLAVDAGESVALYGANGAGKTTVLRILATLLPITAGSAQVLGADLDGEERFNARGRIGLIGHTPALYPELSMRANLQYVADVARIDRSEVERVLETVGLAGAADRLVEAASHGMARRCEIARELMLAPQVLLLDEPHSALDESAVALVAHLVESVTSRGGCAVVASHDRLQVDRLTGRQVLLESGSIS
ncbi:MAG: heme ABC exporter ATP-binding protein CcmA [Acidimicrobiia bacterium]|nr:heme ABC exporter ATP-binding protein CcmA [Acidimicrobiia bacterium]